MKRVEEPEVYLGDGVYVRVEDGEVIFRSTREDSIVALDAVVLDNFLAWIGNIQKQMEMLS